MRDHRADRDSTPTPARGDWSPHDQALTRKTHHAVAARHARNKKAKIARRRNRK